ncbi:MAG: hypothetical protein D6714_00540, partial [Bacteroidetes bacterium]
RAGIFYSWALQNVAFALNGDYIGPKNKNERYPHCFVTRLSCVAIVVVVVQWRKDAGAEQWLLMDQTGGKPDVDLSN